MKMLIVGWLLLAQRQASTSIVDKFFVLGFVARGRTMQCNRLQ